jgi:hypothetical protein
MSSTWLGCDGTDVQDRERQEGYGFDIILNSFRSFHPSISYGGDLITFPSRFFGTRCRFLEALVIAGSLKSCDTESLCG